MKGIFNWFKTITWKKAMIIAGVVGAAAVLVAVSLFVYRTVIDPSAAFEVQAPPVADEAPTATDETLPEADQRFMEDRVNILVMGMDSNEDRLKSDREDFRTDTMLLVTIDFAGNTVDMITVPRDSYVDVKNETGSLYKVNAAAYFGGGMCDSGFMNACDTISGVFGGIPVDYYVAVNMDGLKALVDAIGGVYFDVDITYQMDDIALKPGYKRLNGDEVLAYCRVRKNIGTDINRQQRQQAMIIALLNQIKTSGKVSDIPKIYDSLSSMVYTNLSFEQICALALYLKDFDPDKIGGYVLEGEYHWAYGVYFYLLDQQAKVDLVQDIFGIKIAFDQKHDVHYVLSHTPTVTDAAPEDEDATPVPTDTAAPTVTATPTTTAKPSATATPTDTVSSPADPTDTDAPADTTAPTDTETADPDPSSSPDPEP